jgi:hypothetical protein
MTEAVTCKAFVPGELFFRLSNLVRAKIGLCLILIASLTAGCEREGVKKSIDSISMESVDAETGGKKGGGTHFSITSGELFLDYTYLSNEAEAKAEVDGSRLGTERVIEEGDIREADGMAVGKFSLAENTSATHENNRFCLRWSRVNRFSEVCSTSRQAIEEFRTIYEL